jgi:hypothetical protein
VSEFRHEVLFPVPTPIILSYKNYGLSHCAASHDSYNSFRLLYFRYLQPAALTPSDKQNTINFWILHIHVYFLKHVKLTVKMFWTFTSGYFC